MAGKAFYKVLDGDRSCHGGRLTWPLPTDDNPGEWVVDFGGEIVPCQSGLHLTDCPAKWITKAGLSVFVAEYDGESVRCDDDKIACRRARLVRRLTQAELDAVNIFTSGTHSIKGGHAAAYGSASVDAHGSARVVAYDSASVEAHGSASVEAHGSASVVAYGSVIVEAHGSASVEAHGSAIVEAHGSASVEAHGSAIVKAYDSASVTSYSAENKVALGYLAVQIDRSNSRAVVIRHCPGAAVTCEPAAGEKGV